MSAGTLREALGAAGLPCEVEGREKLAVLRLEADGADLMADFEIRRRALALATEHGFTHAAIELTD
jgi:hypothetical protein